jgi:hypothetical protein
MRTMFNKAKVKSWIKKACKDQKFGYGHGYITDGYIVLVEEQHMHPTILEVFGTLTPECRYTIEQFQKLMNLPDEPVEMIDSKLEFVPEPKQRLRIFYDPKTGKELVIDGKYFDLMDNPTTFEFYTNDSMDRLWIMYSDNVAGIIAPMRMREQLSHINFKVN